MHPASDPASSFLTAPLIHALLCAMEARAMPLLTDLLRAVSRSFYLTLRVLPSAVRPQIGLAYLLARTTDTVADTELLPVAQRLAALHDLRGRILGTRAQPLDFSELAAAQPERPEGGTNAERVLLERAEEAIGLLASCRADDRKLIREVLATITSGQELDLQRFRDARPDHVVALHSDQDLDDYTYRVAGCVGEFWTKMCRAHLFPHAHLSEAALLHDGVCFGKGLQLVNILRDLPRDLRAGRCYLPLEALARAQLAPRDLLNPAVAPRLRPVYDELIDLAETHLDAGWEYANALPRSSVRVRLACAWPVLIGVRTLERLRHANPLDAAHRVKVPREEVRSVILSTVLKYPFPAAWEKLFAQAQGGRT